MQFTGVESNLRECFRVVAAPRAGGEIRELPGVTIASAGVVFQMFNAAFLSGPVRSEDEMARRILLAATHFRSRSIDWAYWVCEGWLTAVVRRQYRKTFSRHGLRHSVDLPGMEAECILPAVRALPEMEVRRVSDAVTEDAFCAIGSLCFHVPLPWFREVFDNRQVWRTFEAWVGYAGGEPVSTAAVVPGGGVLGVYNVATVPGKQRHGYAEAVMRAALADAAGRYGVSRTILQSTPAGYRLYERMGYRTVTSVAVYSS